MALKAQIQSIVQGLSPSPSFFYGTEKEFNNGVDDLDLTNGVFFMFSLQGVDFEQTINNSVKPIYSTYVAMLYKVEFDVINSDQAEPLDNNAINILAQFLVRLKQLRGANNAKVFKVNIGDKTKMKAVYFNYADVNLYGRGFGIELETFNDIEIGCAAAP